MIRRLLRLLFRLLPLLVLIHVIDSGSVIFQKNLHTAVEMTKAARVVGELTMYKALLVKDLAMDTPLPNSIEYYIRQSVKVKIADKPPYQDLWGNNYVLVIRGPKSFKLLSFGPDGVMGTKDDIEVEYSE